MLSNTCLIEWFIVCTCLFRCVHSCLTRHFFIFNDVDGSFILHSVSITGSLFHWVNEWVKLYLRIRDSSIIIVIVLFVCDSQGTIALEYVGSDWCERSWAEACRQAVGRRTTHVGHLSVCLCVLPALPTGLQQTERSIVVHISRLYLLYTEFHN